LPDVFYLDLIKAARRAARAANSARSPQLPLALPQRRRLTPVGWREDLTRSGLRLKIFNCGGYAW